MLPLLQVRSETAVVAVRIRQTLVMAPFQLLLLLRQPLFRLQVVMQMMMMMMQMMMMMMMTTRKRRRMVR